MVDPEKESDVPLLSLIKIPSDAFLSVPEHTTTSHTPSNTPSDLAAASLEPLNEPQATSNTSDEDVHVAVVLRNVIDEAIDYGEENVIVGAASFERLIEAWDKGRLDL